MLWSLRPSPSNRYHAKAHHACSRAKFRIRFLDSRAIIPQPEIEFRFQAQRVLEIRVDCFCFEALNPEIKGAVDQERTCTRMLIYMSKTAIVFALSETEIRLSDV